MSPGSPPLTRGTRNTLNAVGVVTRITPAYAGNTNKIRSGMDTRLDHPRLRGEHKLCLFPLPPSLGSPPLTRGTLMTDVDIETIQGITPAYAGNTYIHKSIRINIRDHPRLRGEHVMESRIPAYVLGSPPLTRGTRVP